jgi:hypothetical protein
MTLYSVPRDGFATSIKTIAAPDQETLLRRIRGYLERLDGIENRTLSGRDAAGNLQVINPGQIQGKGELIAIPGSQSSFLNNPGFVSQVEEFSEEFETVLDVVPVEAFGG